MTILLYVLLFTFFLIETPLVALMVYLYTHVSKDLATAKMRQIIFVVAIAKSLFIFAQIILVLNSLVQIPDAITFVIWSYSICAIILALVDWWALFEVRKIIV